MLPQLGLGYGRIPKAANSMIKRRLSIAAGLEDLFADEASSQDRNWRTKTPHAYFLTAVEARQRFPDIILFSFVREPLSRLASCYRSKIARPDQIQDSLLREGLSKTTGFPEFVKHVSGRSDWRSNIHYRSQAHILGLKGRLAPDFIGRVESLEADWGRLSKLVVASGRPALPALPARGSKATTAQMKSGDLFGDDQALIGLARDRYAKDLSLFYGDVALPGQSVPEIIANMDGRAGYA